MLIITIETGIKILLNSNSIRKTFSITYPSRRTQRIHMDFRQDFKQKQSIIFQIIIVKTVSLPAMEEAFRLPPCIRII